jgi:hypothetical protein
MTALTPVVPVSTPIKLIAFTSTIGFGVCAALRNFATPDGERNFGSGGKQDGEVQKLRHCEHKANQQSKL